MQSIVHEFILSLCVLRVSGPLWLKKNELLLFALKTCLRPIGILRSRLQTHALPSRQQAAPSAGLCFSHLTLKYLQTCFARSV
jgi:hypothetical protein